MLQTLVRVIWQRTEGATAAEYAILVSLIAIVIFGAVALLGQNVLDIFTDDALSTALTP